MFWKKTSNRRSFILDVGNSKHVYACPWVYYSFIEYMEPKRPDTLERHLSRVWGPLKWYPDASPHVSDFVSLDTIRCCMYWGMLRDKHASKGDYLHTYGTQRSILRCTEGEVPAAPCSLQDWNKLLFCRRNSSTHMCWIFYKVLYIQLVWYIVWKLLKNCTVCGRHKGMKSLLFSTLVFSMIQPFT